MLQIQQKLVFKSSHKTGKEQLRSLASLQKDGPTTAKHLS